MIREEVLLTVRVCVRIPSLPLVKDHYGVGFEGNMRCVRYFAFGTLNSIGIGFGFSKYVGWQERDFAVSEGSLRSEI